jgi:hypothetical protein
MINKEEWKDIKGYEGLYKISNSGRVKRLGKWVNAGNGYYAKEKILKNYKKDNGYLVVGLTINSKEKRFYIHRLVSQAFIPNPNNYPCVNHKDETRDNNNIDNLEWCTYEYNINYGSRREKFCKAMSKAIYQYTKNMGFIKKWESGKECKRNGLTSDIITKCCKGEQKFYRNCIWSYNLVGIKGE